MRVDDGADEAGHLGTHAVLGVERGAVNAVVDEPLEQRNVQVVLGAQLQHGGLRPQLLVVACHANVRSTGNCAQTGVPKIN